MLSKLYCRTIYEHRQWDKHNYDNIRIDEYWYTLYSIFLQY